MKLKRPKGYRRDFFHVILWFGAIFLVTSNFFVGRLTAGEDKAYDYSPLFHEVLTRVQDEYVEDVPAKDLYYNALKGMLHGLDKYCALLPAKAYHDTHVPSIITPNRAACRARMTV